MGPAAESFDSFAVTVGVVIRLGRREDMPALEWFGLYSREVIESTFEKAQQGEAIVLVAEANGAVSGQAWIDLNRMGPEPTGYLWAIRVLPCLQRLGIGSRLVTASEQVLRERGFKEAELVVEKENPSAKRFYERLGYVVVGEQIASNRVQRWVLRKHLLVPVSEVGGNRAGKGQA